MVEHCCTVMMETHMHLSPPKPTASNVDMCDACMHEVLLILPYIFYNGNAFLPFDSLGPITGFMTFLSVVMVS